MPAAPASIQAAENSARLCRDGAETGRYRIRIFLHMLGHLVVADLVPGGVRVEDGGRHQHLVAEHVHQLAQARELRLVGRRRQWRRLQLAPVRGRLDRIDADRLHSRCRSSPSAGRGRRHGNSRCVPAPSRDRRRRPPESETRTRPAPGPAARRGAWSAFVRSCSWRQNSIRGPSARSGFRTGATDSHRAPQVDRIYIIGTCRNAS